MPSPHALAKAARITMAIATFLAVVALLLILASIYFYDGGPGPGLPLPVEREGPREAAIINEAA